MLEAMWCDDGVLPLCGVPVDVDAGGAQGKRLIGEGCDGPVPYGWSGAVPGVEPHETGETAVVAMWCRVTPPIGGPAAHRWAAGGAWLQWSGTSCSLRNREGT